MDHLDEVIKMLDSMADIVAGTAACMCGHYVTTVSGTLNFLLPADDTDYVYCEAKQLRQGKLAFVSRRNML